MNVYYITFRSVTYAQRGESLLQGQRYRCMLMRTPRWMEAQGCGYALKVWTKEVDPVVEVLQDNHVMLRKIYIQRSDGKLEEMAL